MERKLFFMNNSINVNSSLRTEEGKMKLKSMGAAR
jgi:hypothetical protein